MYLLINYKCNFFQFVIPQLELLLLTHLCTNSDNGMTLTLSRNHRISRCLFVNCNGNFLGPAQKVIRNWHRGSWYYYVFSSAKGYGKNHEMWFFLWENQALYKLTRSQTTKVNNLLINMPSCDLKRLKEEYIKMENLTCILPWTNFRILQSSWWI